MAIKTTTKPAPIPTKTAKPAVPAAKASAPAPAPAPYKPTQQEIAARAFEIYQREGGTEQDNWLRAERELIARGRR
jgi:hypothetical protein